MTHDVRAIANLVLDIAEANGRSISNMHINKIVYFLHVDYLVKFGRPLVSAKIEAWEHGPVFRELYSQFKKFGEGKIAHRAVATSPATGQAEKVRYSLESDEAGFLAELATRYSAMSAAALRAQSHIQGGPWDQVWHHEGTTSPTMQISNDAILEWYGRTARH